MRVSLYKPLPKGMDEISFPDSQPSFRFGDEWKTYGASDRPIEISARITSGHELLRLLTFSDAAARAGFTGTFLYLNYVLGGRTDRPIDGGDVTIAVVGAAIRSSSLPILATRVLDPHSDVTLAVLPRAEAVYIEDLVTIHVTNFFPNEDYAVIIPDQGAVKRATLLARGAPLIQLLKGRAADGSLSYVPTQEPQFAGHAIIVDDVCDGGGTFAAIAKAVATWKVRPKSLSLVVTHGIFSKGPEIAGIDYITTTNSYRDLLQEASDRFHVLRLL